MPRYLLLYRLPVGVPRTTHPDPDAAARGRAQWAAWATAAGPALIDFGAPTRPLGASSGAPWTNDDTSASLGGFTIVEARDEADLATLLRDHPHLGTGTLEVHALAELPPDSSSGAPPSSRLHPQGEAIAGQPDDRTVRP